MDEPGGREFIVAAVQMKREFGLIEQETPNPEKNDQGGGQSDENCDLKLINHNNFNQLDTQSCKQQHENKKQKYNFNWDDKNLILHKNKNIILIGMMRIYFGTKKCHFIQRGLNSTMKN